MQGISMTSPAIDRRAVRLVLVAVLAMILGACTALPPASRDPKTPSVALSHPEQTRLGQQFDSAAREHDGNSAFRIITVGVDGFAARMQMIESAERTLDLQYFIFRGDQTGQLLTAALRRAADRGVRIRVLVDDGDVVPGDEQILALDGHAGAEVRYFNPFAYRGYSKLRRSLEFLFNGRRLDYRMHNKLLVVDNSVALVGGRNIGNQYFQMDPHSQFADDDVFAAGPIATRLSATFDEYWSSQLAIPARALTARKPTRTASVDPRVPTHESTHQLQQSSKTNGVDYVGRSASGEPYAGMLSGRLPLVWAPAAVVCDSPDKKRVEHGTRAGQLMAPAVAAATGSAQSQLLMVTPYFVPSHDELTILKDLRGRDVHVGILTNSLESTPGLTAFAGYTHYRVPLLNAGMDLYESRALLGNARGSGQTLKLSKYGNYGLHAKLFVIDRQKVFIGSMNYDQRSRHINTEIGLIIDSGELAQQTAARFTAMVQMDNAYTLALRPGGADAKSRLVWDTREDGKPIEYRREPARSTWQRVRVWWLSLLPLDSEL
jgi:putative cardiolipin synthase